MNLVLEITAFDLLLFCVLPVVMFSLSEVPFNCLIYSTPEFSRQLKNSKKIFGETLQKFHGVLNRIQISVLPLQTPGFGREKRAFFNSSIVIEGLEIFCMN